MYKFLKVMILLYMCGTNVYLICVHLLEVLYVG